MCIYFHFCFIIIVFLLLTYEGKPLSHYLVNWRESQISKGLNTAGFNGEIKVLDTSNSDFDSR